MRFVRKEILSRWGLLPSFVDDIFLAVSILPAEGVSLGRSGPQIKNETFSEKTSCPRAEFRSGTPGPGDNRVLKTDQGKGGFMRITTRGRYALRASLALARLGKDGSPVSINNLSEQENISSVFLEQIFFRLKKAGIVTSVRGPGGGFYFAQSLDKLTIKAILDAAGEDLDLNNCDKSREDCDRIGICLTHSIWKDVTDLVNNYFRSITIASILEKYTKKSEKKFKEL
jgi:Rrf2 family iron-sulfur cluster assembly transcriptional regulator